MHYELQLLAIQLLYGRATKGRIGSVQTNADGVVEDVEEKVKAMHVSVLIVLHSFFREGPQGVQHARLPDFLRMSVTLACSMSSTTVTTKSNLKYLPYSI